MKNYVILFLVILSFLLLGISLTSAALTDGLVSYWKLDDSSGNAVDELSVNDGSSTGVLYSQTGATVNTGTSFGFDDSSDKIEKVNPVGVVSVDLSGTFWLNATSMDNIDTIIWIGKSGPTVRIQFNFRDTDLLEINAYDGSEDTAQTDYSSYFNQWTFIYWEVTATRFKVYLNNVSKIDTAITYSRLPSATRLWIGNGDGSARGINGFMDEVSLYNRTLSEAEINSLWNGGLGLVYPFTPTDSCSCPGAGNNWEIDMSDYCNITDACDLTTGTLSFTGAGITRINETINTTNLGDPGPSGVLRILSNALIWIN